MPPCTKKWVKSIAQECELDSNKLLYKKMDETHDWHVKGLRTIVLPTQHADELEKLLERQQMNDPKILFATQAVKHELGHIHHQDNKTRHWIVSVCATFAHYGINALISVGKKSCTLQSPKTFLEALTVGLFYAGLAYPKFMLTNKLAKEYGRFCEFRADTFAVDRAQTEAELQAMIDDYKVEHAQLKHVYNNADKFFIPNTKKKLSENYHFKMIKFLYNKSRSTQTFGDWIEQYPALIRFLEYQQDEHPIPFDRMNMAQRALAEFNKTKSS